MQLLSSSSSFSFSFSSSSHFHPIPSHPIPSHPHLIVVLSRSLARACPVLSCLVNFLPDNSDPQNNQKIGNRLLILHALLLSWINLIQLVLVCISFNLNPYFLSIQFNSIFQIFHFAHITFNHPLSIKYHHHSYRTSFCIQSIPTDRAQLDTTIEHLLTFIELITEESGFE